MIKGMVSAVIPIIRNDPHVAGCVEAIKNSTYKNVEIIVVDEGKERSYQRNVGIKKARGEYLIWIDSDMLLHPNLLEDCVKKIEDGSDFYAINLTSTGTEKITTKPTAIYIPERIVTEGWFGRLRDWERQFYNGSLVDVVRFIRTADCPLFDEELHGVEDSDWERQIKVKNFVTSDYPFYHHDKVGVIRYLKKKAYYAKSLGAYKRKNPNDKLLTFKYRCWDVFVQNGKWKRLISRPDLAIQMFILVFARGVIYLCAKKS